MIPYLLGGLFVALLVASFVISELDHPTDEDPQ